MDHSITIGSQPESAEAMQPRHRSLNHPAIDSKPAAMLGTSAGALGVYAARSELLAMRIGIVRAVGVQLLGPLPRMSDLTAQRRLAGQPTKLRPVRVLVTRS